MKRLLFVALALALPLASSLAAQGPALSPYQAAADYSAEQDGLAFLVMHKGKVVFENYPNGHSLTKTKHIYSGTKSFASAAAIVAEAEGLLELDEPVAKTITEWASDEDKNQITIRHLLSFSSGLTLPGEQGMERKPDRYKAALEARTRQDPGTRFRYTSLHLMVFGEVMKRKLTAARKKDPKVPGDIVAYVKQKILDPIGCKVGFWMRDRAKNPVLSYGANMTAQEWAKFGQLVLQKGRWGNKQLLPQKRLRECFLGSKASPVYGLNWWLLGKWGGRAGTAPKDTVAAMGLYHQNLYVIPSRELVIVRFGKDRSRRRFDNAQFLKLVLEASAKPSVNRPDVKPAQPKKRKRRIL